MLDKRPYKEILASVETHIIYINNHLGNIDTHLEKLNGIQSEQNTAITKNTMGRRIIYGIGGTLLSGGGIALILKLAGIY